MAVSVAELATVDLLRGVGTDQLVPASRVLAGRDLPAGSTLVNQGDPATSFALVVSGELRVTRHDHGGEELLAVVGPGSIVGELALLGGRPRAATVTSVGPARVLTGDRAAFVTLLGLPTVTGRLADLVSLRLAEDAPLVAVSGRDGGSYTLRPLRPDDRPRLEAGIAAMSDESLYRRFFTGGRPGEAIVEHLLDVDYVDHFAWVLGDADGDRGLGVARYARRRDDRACAEAAFALVDDHQGRGLGTMLLGALAVAAGAAGIDRLYAEVLSDNRPMRAVLDKAGASWATVEAGVVSTEVEVARARALLDEGTADRVLVSVRQIVTAAGLALTRRVD